MTRTINDLLTRAVPRYTSYPTAPQWHAEIGPDDYRTWLATLDPDKPLSLYLHVPYCQNICWYCGCNMKLAARYSTVADYVETLIREIDLVADTLPARMEVSHLHWGGGTPTSLSPDDLQRVMSHVWSRFNQAPSAELAIESDPRTLTGEMIDRIGALGFNRASFGVQEFDPVVQAAINRIQPPEMVAHAVQLLRAVGVDAINFDLIYGLPHQTTEMVKSTIETCLSLAPDRLALFGYAHVPWVAKRQRKIETAALPGARERLAQATAAAETLRAQGYTQIGMDHFAKPNDALSIAAANGTLRRNFQGYTPDEAPTLIGFGATSIGRLPHGYVQNNPETGAWARAIEAGEFATSKGYALSPDDRLYGAVIEAIMCYGRADLTAIAATQDQPADWAAAALREAEPYIPDGLAIMADGQIALRAGAEPFVRLVAAAFDQHLHRAEARHSLAV